MGAASDAVDFRNEPAAGHLTSVSCFELTTSTSAPDRVLERWTPPPSPLLLPLLLPVLLKRDDFLDLPVGVEFLSCLRGIFSSMVRLWPCASSDESFGIFVFFKISDATSILPPRWLKLLALLLLLLLPLFLLLLLLLLCLYHSEN